MSLLGLVPQSGRTGRPVRGRRPPSSTSCIADKCFLTTNKSCQRGQRTKFGGPHMKIQPPVEILIASTPNKWRFQVRPRPALMDWVCLRAESGGMECFEVGRHCQHGYISTLSSANELPTFLMSSLRFAFSTHRSLMISNEGSTINFTHNHNVKHLNTH